MLPKKFWENLRYFYQDQNIILADEKFATSSYSHRRMNFLADAVDIPLVPQAPYNLASAGGREDIAISI